MSITDELRKVAAKTECANGRCEKLYRGDLDHIADRIDEQVRREYTELPKDADGVTIRIGDELDSMHYEDGTVAGIRYYEGCRTLVAVRPHGWDTATWNDPIEYTHAKPDTWERIIEDAQTDGIRNHNEGKPSDFDALVERCKRLAGEA